MLALVDFVLRAGGEGCLAARLAPWAPGSPLSVAFGFPRKSSGLTSVLGGVSNLGELFAAVYGAVSEHGFIRLKIGELLFFVLFCQCFFLSGLCSYF